MTNVWYGWRMTDQTFYHSFERTLIMYYRKECTVPSERNFSIFRRLCGLQNRSTWRQYQSSASASVLLTVTHRPSPRPAKFISNLHSSCCWSPCLVAWSLCARRRVQIHPVKWKYAPFFKITIFIRAAQCLLRSLRLTSGCVSIWWVRSRRKIYPESQHWHATRW